MKRSRDFLLFFALFGLAVVIQWLWIDRVNPFPDRDAINQAWYPVRNFASAWMVVPLDWSFFTENLFNPKYPPGILALVVLLSPLISLEALASQPFYLSYASLFALATLPFLFGGTSRSRSLYFLLILSFPLFVLSYRGFSLFGFNVIFCFAGTVYYFQYLRYGARLHLLCFIFFFGWGAIFKQLGLVYLLVLGLCSLSYLFSCQERREKGELVFAWLILLLWCVQFYNLTNVIEYLRETMLHNPDWTTFLFLALGGVLGTALFSVALMTARRGQEFSFRESRGLFLQLGALLVWMLVLCIDATDASSGKIYLILSSVVLVTGLLVFYNRFRLATVDSLEALYILVLILCSSILYCSALGHSLYNFFLPAALIFHRISLNLSSRFESHGMNLVLGIVLILNLLFSQFFPSLESWERHFGVYGANLFVNGVNNVVCNPLSWKKGEFADLRSELGKELETYELQSRHEEAIYLIDKAHFYTRLALEFKTDFQSPLKEIYRLQNIPPSQREPLRLDFYASKEELIRDWVNHFVVSYIVVMDEPFTRAEGDPPPIEQFVKEGSAVTDQNGFLASLTRYALGRMKEEGLLKELFETVRLPRENPRITLHIRKGLKPWQESEKFFPSLSDFLHRYWRHQELEVMPDYFSRLLPQHQHEIREVLAGAYFGQASHYLDRFEYYRSYLYLRKAYELSPKKEGLWEDLVVVERQLPESHWTILKEQGFQALTIPEK